MHNAVVVREPLLHLQTFPIRTVGPLMTSPNSIAWPSTLTSIPIKLNLTHPCISTHQKALHGCQIFRNYQMTAPSQLSRTFNRMSYLWIPFFSHPSTDHTNPSTSILLPHKRYPRFPTTPPDSEAIRQPPLATALEQSPIPLRSYKISATRHGPPLMPFSFRARKPLPFAHVRRTAAARKRSPLS